MRALSIRQPWADLILSGEKDVENRTWYTHHRGLLVVHASRGGGGLLGTVEVVDVVRGYDSRWAEPGDVWHWVLTNPRRFHTAIAYSGQLSLFNIDPVTAAKLRRML
jgi:hypothetical protein